MEHKIPKIIGRWADDEGGDTDERYETEKRFEVEVAHLPMDSSVVVELFESLDDEDRGGIVLRFKSRLYGGGWDCHAVRSSDGLDLHFCGDGEAAAFLEALSMIIEEFRQDSRTSCKHMSKNCMHNNHVTSIKIRRLPPGGSTL